MSVNVLILTWHQVYNSGFAGGYIRLKEFLKYWPKDISYLLLDNKPSIYIKDVKNKSLIQYKTPSIIKPLLKRAFIIWYLLETLTSMIAIYKKSVSLITKHNPKVIYIPIGEFYHMYIPGILLKRKFPKTRLVVDILNYENQDKNILDYFMMLRKNGISRIRATAIVSDGSISSYIIRHTMYLVDYIVTVSPNLVERITKDYKKKTVTFTPSGVVKPKKISPINMRKYLCIYVGRMNVEKGIMDILDTWHHVIKEIPHAKLALVGAIDKEFEKVIRKKISFLNLNSNIDFYGPVSEEKKYKLLNQAQLFLHLAKYEPLFPVIGILEGMIHGQQTIVYDMKVLRSQRKKLHSIRSIHIINNGNIKKVADKIIYINNLQENEKNKLCKEAFHFALQYNWSKIAQIQYKVINIMLNSNTI